MSAGYYAGYIPSSMYQLLLGVCHLGSEPLVYCHLHVLFFLDGRNIFRANEAHECAQTCKWYEELAGIVYST